MKPYKLSTKIQLLLFVAGSCSLGIVPLPAQENDPPLVASLPDEGQPPAPEVVPSTPPETPETPAKPADSEPAKPDAAASQPVVSEPAASEPVASEQTPPQPPTVPAVTAPAEVANAAQVEAQAPAPPTAEASTSAEVRELSVEPVLEKRPILPADRPAWVGAANETSERVHRLYVASFTANSRDQVELDEMLDEPLVAAVRRYLDETLFPREGAWRLDISPEFIRQNLLDNSTSYVASMTTQTGTEYQKWVILQVTPEQREYFSKLLVEQKQRERMSMLGVGLAGVLGLTGLVNLVFNRRRRRYPSTLPPISMAIMPGQSDPPAANVAHERGVQFVSAPAAQLPVIDRRKGRSCCSGRSRAWLIPVLICVVLIPAITTIKAKRRAAERESEIQVRLNGEVYDIDVHQPIIEKLIRDHH
jgi:hypothetical protein